MTAATVMTGTSMGREGSVPTDTGTFPGEPGYCRVTPSEEPRRRGRGVVPPRRIALPTSIGLVPAVLRRSRADWPVYETLDVVATNLLGNA
jgi:hypothetical protein